LVAAFACIGTTASFGQTPAPPPAALACANGRLPAEILDGPAAKPPNAPLRTIVVAAPKARLTLAVADDPEMRELGLMCVTRLRPHGGMLFVFESAAGWEFWMKNTLVPLDMIWLEADGTITSVAANVPSSQLSTPDDAVARRRGHGLYVIELAAGEAQADGIVAGGKLAIPQNFLVDNLQWL
jgi:uncharacterized membrane protein (UPF0127 family)